MRTRNIGHVVRLAVALPPPGGITMGTNRWKMAITLMVVFLLNVFSLGASFAQPMIFPGAEWETASPESQNINPVLLEAAIEALDADFDSPDRALVIIVNGRLVWESQGSDQPFNVRSVTKSFTSTVLGLLIDDGRATLETRAADLVPSLAEHYPDVTLRHFTTMTSGYQNTGTSRSEPDWWEPSEPLFTPGSYHGYSNPGMDQLSNALTQIAGEAIEDLFRRSIADPIGMSDWYWPNYVDDPPNNPPGSVAPVNRGLGGLEISAKEAARFGHLFLNGGEWDGQQLISAWWVGEATRVQVPYTVPEWPDGGYSWGIRGYNWNRNGIGPDGTLWQDAAPEGLFWAMGGRDSRIKVIPEWNMVVVKTADDDQGISWSDFFTLVESALLSEADFDGDGDVDGDDFLTWQSSFGIDDGGDTDYDGDTDGDDFLTWQSQFGTSSGLASAAVPEPASFVLALGIVAVGAFLHRGEGG